MNLPAIRKCVRCKRTVKINAKGRCSACYNYLIRNEVERPQRLINIRNRFCIDCKVNPVYCMDRCKVCYDYQLYNGRKRPVHLRKKDRLDCKNPNCRKPLRLCKKPVQGYCGKCYEYYRKRGIDRPARFARFQLEPGFKPCKNPNCDKPLKRQDRCADCLNWLLRYHRERPAELCPQRVDLGWCECGEIATTEYRFKVERTEYTLILCDNCLEIETSLIL